MKNIKKEENVARESVKAHIGVRETGEPDTDGNNVKNGSRPSVSDDSKNKNNLTSESEYTVGEFVSKADMLEVPQEVIKVALESRGIHKTTLSNAKNVIQAFLKKEVK